MTDNKLISTDKHESKLKDLSQIIEDSWLGISIDYDTLSNPLLTFPPHLHDKPHLWLAYLMSRPEYFAFMGREIFNIEFLPFQTTILKEMWEHKFPMLIGTRGMSKCVTGNTRIVTQKGIRRIRDVVGETGGHEERIYLKDEKVYTENNKWIGVEYGWKNRRDKTLKLTVNCGLQIEVKYDHKIRVVPKGMKDEDIVWRPANEIKKGDRLLVQCPQENLSRMPGLEITDKALEKKIRQFSEQKGIPGEFWQFNLKQSNIFISYLLNKFSVRKGDRVAFIFTDTDLLRELQLYIYYYTGFLFSISPLGVLECDFSRKIREKFLDEVTSIESGEAVTYDLHLKSDHTYLSNGFVSHNSFTLGMYALLRAALLPGRKVVIVGSVFRQSKIIFQYIDTIYQNSGRLREMLGNNRPKKSPDKWELSVGSSLITAIPVGTGDSIRGLRCLTNDSLIQTENGLIKFRDFIDGKTYRVINKDGELERPDKIFCTPPTDVYEITTQYGYKLECSKIHRVMTTKGERLAKDLEKGDKILIDNTNYFPSDLIETEVRSEDDPSKKVKFTLDEDIAWLMGVLITKGINTNRNYLTVRHESKEFVEKVMARFPQYEWELAHKVAKDDGRGWGCNDRYTIKTTNLELRTAMREMGFDYWISEDAEIPSGILQSPKDIVVSFLSGLYEADYRKANINVNNDKKTLIITYAHRGNNLLKQLHILMLKLGIVSSFFLKGGIYGRVTCRTNNALDLVKMLNVDKWKNLEETQRTSIKNENFLRVKTVEKQPEQRVLYDFHLPKTHSFMANGLSNLNSNDILADEFSCLTKNNYLQTDQGLIKVEDYLDGDQYKLINQYGEPETPDNIFVTPPTDVYEIKTKYGFKFKCSNIHKSRTVEGWKLAKDLQRNDKLVIGKQDYFPSRYISKQDTKLDEKLAWLFGLLISDGWVAGRNYFSFFNTDKTLIDLVKSEFSNLHWTETFKEEYIDDRGWVCKDCWVLSCGNTELRSTMKEMGVDYVTAKDKTIPKDILKSPRSVILSFLSGLYEGDGSAFYVHNKKTGKVSGFQTVYYSASTELLEALQLILLKFNVFSYINRRDETNYRLVTTGDNAVKLFKLLDVLKWKEITSPELKNVYDNGDCLPVVSVTKLPEKEVLYDFHLPETHSFIGNGIIQHNSQNREIFENVIAGFNAVSSSPVQKVKEYYQNKIRETLGVELEDAQDDYFPDNQLILSGTAYYYFNHFAQYWERWRSIINSKGNKDKLVEVFNGEIPEDLDWRDFSVIRVPVELLPKGYMDQANLARSKATLSSHLYDMEFSACSTADTPIQTLEGVKQIIDVQPGKDKVLTHTGEFKTVDKLTKRPYSGELLEFTYKRSPFTYKFTPDHPFFCEDKGFIELEDILYKRGQLSSVADNNTVSNIYVPPKRKKTKKEKVETLDIRDYVNEELYLEYNNQLFTYSDTDIQVNVTRKTAQKIIELHEKNTSLTSISKMTSCTIEQITKVIDIIRGGGGLDKELSLDYELGRFISLFSICGDFTTGSSSEFVINFKQLNKANEIAKSLPGSEYGSRSHFLFYSNITAFTKFCEQKIGISSKKIKKVSRHQVSFTDKFTRDLLFNLMSRPSEPSDFILQPVLLFCNENFIRGYFHTLFCLSYKQLNKIKIKNTVCTNRKIIEQVKLMAEYLGLSPILNIDGRDNSKKFLSFNTYDSYKILEQIFLEKTGYFENLRKVSPIRNELGNIERQISSFKRIPYEGMVYNLEVEGDHSYSTPDATMHNCFSKDSNGFFKASLIESCTANEINDIQVRVGEDEYETVIYDPRMYGDRSKEYVFGIDPASEVDKFAIVILELHENHCRIVHVWTTNAEKFKRQKRAGIDIAIKDDYYSYCSRKIRDLMKRFPCTRICLDAQGGGKAISEALRDQDNIEDDEQKIWPIINPEKSQDTDGENGLHILELVQFASYEYTRDANHGLRKDFEDRKCLFPRYNPAALAYATATNPSQHDEMEIEEISIYDTMEDNFMEIQELKKELSQIVVTLTGGGREKFDTPEVKISGSEKGRARKDRYSALVMANAGARKIIRGEDGPGFIQTSFERPSADDKNKDSGFIGPSWAANKLDGLYG